MKHLIPMTKFVIERNMMLANKEISFNQCNLQILQYANFLMNPLNLDMFEGDKAIFKNCEIVKRSTYSIVRFDNCPVWFTWEIKIIESLIYSNLELVNDDFLTTI